MKFSAVAFSAVVGLAAAQLEMLSEVPECALDCFTTSIASTSCGLTDFHCQCKDQYEKIQETTLTCLCNSECTTTDLAKVYDVSIKLCTETLKQSGETFEAGVSMDSGICSNGKGAAAAPAASSASSNSSGTAQPTGNSTSTSSSSPSATSGAEFEGSASSFGKSIAAIAVGGLAFFAM